MGFIKKSTLPSVVVVSSSVYTCKGCDHTEVVKDVDIDEKKKCPKCEAEMMIISTSTEDEEADNKDTTDTAEETEKE